MYNALADVRAQFIKYWDIQALSIPYFIFEDGPMAYCPQT